MKNRLNNRSAITKHMSIQGVGKFPIPTNHLEQTKNGFQQTLQQSQQNMIQVKFGGLSPQQVDAANKHIDEKLFFQQKVLQSKLLENDPVFRFLKGKLVELTRAETRMSHTNKNYSKTLSTAIRKLLRQVVLTKDRIMQQTYLSRVYDWVQKQLQEKESGGAAANRSVSPLPGHRREGVKLPSISELNKDFCLPQINAIPVANQTQNTPEKSSSFISGRFNSSIKNYQSSAKKQHNTSVISSNIANMSTTYNSPDRTKLHTSHFSRESPINSAFYSANPISSEKTRQIYTSQKARGLLQKNISRSSLHSSYLIDHSQGKNRTSTRIGGSLPPQSGPVPIEARSNYVHYAPNQRNETEQKLEQAWYLKQNQEVCQKRAVQQEKRVVAEWGQSKARIEQQISRKIERQVFGANMESQGFVWKGTKNVPNQPDTDLNNREKTMQHYQNAYNHISSDEETSITGESTIVAGGDLKQIESTTNIQKSSQSQQRCDIFDMTINENGQPMSDQEANSDNDDNQTSSKFKSSLTKIGLHKRQPAINFQNRGSGTINSSLSFLPKIPQMTLMNQITFDAKRQKIENLRKYQGGLIKAQRQNSNGQDINNIFTSSTNPKDVITLSVYNRAAYYLNNGNNLSSKSSFGGAQLSQHHRPKTSFLSNSSLTQTGFKSALAIHQGNSTTLRESNVNLDQSIQQEQVTEQQQLANKRAIHMRNVRGLSEGRAPLVKQGGVVERKKKQQASKSLNHDYRMQQIKEISAVKQLLAKEDINCPITLLQRAILFPDDKKNANCYVKSKDNDDKEYLIRPDHNLITNPFKKVVKGKKKKGKKKKK